MRSSRNSQEVGAARARGPCARERAGVSSNAALRPSGSGRRVPTGNGARATARRNAPASSRYARRRVLNGLAPTVRGRDAQRGSSLQRRDRTGVATAKHGAAGRARQIDGVNFAVLTHRDSKSSPAAVSIRRGIRHPPKQHAIPEIAVSTRSVVRKRRPCRRDEHLPAWSGIDADAPQGDRNHARRSTRKQRVQHRPSATASLAVDNPSSRVGDATDPCR